MSAVKDLGATVDVVCVTLDQVAALVADFGDAAEAVAVIIIQIAAAFHREGLVDAAAVCVAGLEDVARIALFDHLSAGVVDR